MTTFEELQISGSDNFSVAFDVNAVVETADTGGGIDETVKAKIFNPFFTTKDKGLGLGLSVVYKIVNQQNGQISLDNKERGTLATLILPIS